MITVKKLIFFIPLIILSGFLYSKEYRLQKVPGWVIPISWDKNLELPEYVSDGNYYRVYERQILLEKKELYQYKRHVIELTDISGVEGNSQISVDFDPIYEELIFHNIEIVRDGVRIDKLKGADIEVFQRETDMDALLYDGAKTFNAILNDIRPGDILIYSYTIKGSNPIFKNKFSQYYNLEWSVPVGKTYLRILNRKGSRLRINYLNRKYEAKTAERVEETEYIWEVKTDKTLKWDSSTPSWYNPLSIVEITEFESWGELKTWAYSLFDLEYNRDDVKAVYKDIVKKVAAERVRLLRFLIGFRMKFGIWDWSPVLPPINPLNLIKLLRDDLETVRISLF